MAESKSFVDKVYDSYIKEDYSYGDNNLNPKREIRKQSFKDTDDQMQKILESIKLKVDEIAIKYPDTDFKTPNTIIGNFGGDGRSNGLPSTVREAINRAGGSGNTVVMIPNMDGSTTPLMQEIELTMAKVLSTIASSSADDGTSNIDENDLGINGLSLFSISCNGTYNPITKSLNSDTEEDLEEDKEEKESEENEGEGANVDIVLNTSSKDDTADSIMVELVNDAMEKANKAVKENEASARQCALKDLGLLKGFLAILKIIQTLKQAINPIMNILMDTAKIITLAAGAWVNPAGVSEIIQRVVVKLMAVMVMMVSKLVQMFWEMLGLDCLTEQTKDIVDQIESALAGVTSTYNKCERVAMSFGADVEHVKDAFEEASSAINDALADLNSDAIMAKFENIQQAAVNIYNNDLGGIEGIKQKGINAVQSTGAYDDIMSTIEDIRSLRTAAEETIDKLVKSKGGKAVDQTVRKIIAQLDDVRAV